MGRSKNRIDFRLLTKVSKLYYEDNLSQDEIVKRLHISRSTISRLLAQAREEGIVKIVVIPPTGTYATLESSIEQKFAIEEVIVADVPAPASPQMMARELGAAAANYLLRVIEPQDVIGVSWGYTLRGMVTALEPKNFPNVRIVQSKKTREVYLMDEHVRTAVDLLPNITLAFVGVGSLNSYSISVRDETILTRSDLDEAIANGAVGDIANRFFNADGQSVQTELNDRIIGIDLDHLRNISRVVGVAGGSNKFEPIRAALRGKLIDVLITDQSTAKTLAKG